MKRIKRLLAFVLCICVIAACWPAEMLEAETILASTDALSYTLNGANKTIYYTDDFATEADFTAALGSYAGSAYQFTWQEGQLISQSSSLNNALFYGIKDYATMQNYTVRAEVSGEAGSGAATLVAYGSGDVTNDKTSGYEFCIYGGKFFRLGRRVNGSFTQLAGGTSGTKNLITYYLSDYEVGDLLELSLQVVTNAAGNVELTCKASLAGGEEVTILTYTDESDAKITSGAPGLKNTKNTGTTISSISVTSQAIDVTCLYADNFSYENAYMEALGDAGVNNIYTWSNNALTIEDSTRISLFKGIEGYADLQNYTVSADFTFSNLSNQFNGVMAYGSSDSTKKTTSYGYEFAVSSGKLRLYRRSNSNSTTLAGDTNAYKVADLLGYEAGDTIRLSLTAITNADNSVTLICKTFYENEEKTIFEVTDSSSEVITSGTAGLRGTSVGSTVDNIYVKKEEASNASDIALPFTETFEGTREEVSTLWNSGDVINLKSENGNAKAVLDSTVSSLYLTGSTAAQSWTNYVYEAEVTMTDTTFNDGTTSYAGISAAVNNNNKGYEFALMYGKNSDTYYLRLYDRIHGEALGTKTYAFSFNEPVNLKMEVYENSINCYANNVLVITAEVEYDLIGTIGICTSRKNSEYDNLSVRAIEGIAYTQKAISLTVGANETQRNITWYANTSVAGKIQYAKKDGDSFPTVYSEATATVATTNDGAFYSNKATLTDLAADTEYVYRLINGETVSDVYSFKTDGTGEFSFFFAGDPQIGASDTISDAQQWGATLKAAVAAFPGTNLLLTSGDQTQRVECEDEYAGYLEHDELKSLTSATAIGNHDEYSDSYSQHFNNPNVTSYGSSTAGSDYWYTYNNVLFLNVNTNNTSVAEHRAFMQEAIAANADVDWKIVVMHHSIYSAAGHATDEAVLNLREGLVPVFEELDIDVVLMGHDHVYVRSYMMENFVPDTSNGVESSVADPTGILYLTANSASGSKYYNMLSNIDTSYAAVKSQEKTPTISNVTVTSNSFKITTYRVNDMSVLDTFEIKKNVSDIAIPYEEDFEGTQKDLAMLWNNADTVTIETENGNKQVVLNETVSSMYLTGSENAKEWSSYAYEADVTMTTDVYNSKVTAPNAGISAAVNGSNKGYEFTLMYMGEKYSVRLYDRINGKVLGSATFNWELDSPVRLRMEVSDNKIKCYAEGELLIIAQVTGELKGTIGICANGRVATVDNLSVTRFVEENNVVSAPIANNEGIYFFDDFSESVVTENNKWSQNVLDIVNNTAVLSGDKGLLYLTADEGYTLLKDYHVSAKIKVGEENNVYEKTIVGAIVGRTTGETTGYEFGMVFSSASGYLRLYDRTTGTILAKSSDIVLELGKEYVLSMICIGNTIICYVDGTQVFSVVDTANTSGSVGMRTIGTVYYDDFLLTTPDYVKTDGDQITVSPATGDSVWNQVQIAVGIFAVSGLALLFVISKKRKFLGEREI